MNIFLTITAILSGYFLLVFVGFRLVVPFMGFKQYSPPTNLPQEVRETILELENKSTDQMSYLKAVYNLIMQKNNQQWHHGRFKAATHLHRLFVKNLQEIWQTKKFIYCTGINFVIYTMLVNSKFFKVSDIKVKHCFANMILHQYLQVKIGDKWIDVDPAGTGIRGKPLGTHLAGFG